MILDSSAVVAVVLGEPGHEQLVAKLLTAEVIGIGAPTLVEVSTVLLARLGTDPLVVVSRFLAGYAVEVIEFTDLHWREAASAYLRFGRGRHPAKLNYGDCLSYATASVARKPLLCIGNDFPQTDLSLA